VTENRSDIEAAIKSFEKMIDRFPHCTEGYALYGQVARAYCYITIHFFRKEKAYMNKLTNVAL
jgi:hypothetical protein